MVSHLRTSRRQDDVEFRKFHAPDIPVFESSGKGTTESETWQTERISLSRRHRHKNIAISTLLVVNQLCIPAAMVCWFDEYEVDDKQLPSHEKGIVHSGTQ